MSETTLDWDWLLYGAIALGLGATAWSAATNDGSHAQQRELRLQKRLSNNPGAVRIKGQPRRALKQWAPSVALCIALVWGLPQFKRHGVAWLCDHYGAEVTAHVVLNLVCYGIPAVVVLMMGVVAFRSWRVLRGGYWPPLETVVFHDTVAITGWRAKAHGWTGLVAMPLLMAVVIYLGHDTYRTFMTPDPARRASARQANVCAVPTAGETPLAR